MRPILLGLVTLLAFVAISSGPFTATAAEPDGPAARAKLERRADTLAARAAAALTGADAVPLASYETYADAPRTAYGIERWEEVRVTVGEGVSLPCWFVPLQSGGGLGGGAAKGTVVVLHGWTSDIRFALHQSRFLLESGYQLFLVSARANTFAGRDGDYRGFLKQDLADIAAALQFVRTREDVDPDRVALYGFSWGGLKAVLAGARDPRLRAVIDDAGPLAVELALPRFLEFMPPHARDDETLRRRYLAAFTQGVEERLGYGSAVYDAETAAAAIAPRPLLVLHGEDDETVTLASSRRIHAAAKEPKRLVVGKRFGHCLGMHRAPDEYVPAVVQFLDEHLAR